MRLFHTALLAAMAVVFSKSATAPALPKRSSRVGRCVLPFAIRLNTCIFLSGTALAATSMLFSTVARGSVTQASAITLGPLFSDHAVFQQGKPVPVWGFAAPGEDITVSYRGQQVRTIAGHDGRWLAVLASMPAAGAGADLVIGGRETVTLRDIVVGDVWLCSGQSNMAWNVARAANAENEIAAADFPLLRHIRVGVVVAETPTRTAKTSGWRSSSAGTVGDFTAVGYYFGRHLHRELGVPIGLVNASCSGTPIESWMSRATLESDPAFAVVNDRWREVLAGFPEKKANFDLARAAYDAGETQAKATGTEALTAFRRNNRRPESPEGPGHLHTPSGLFNGMIHPLLPTALRGTIWYQGEGNAARAGEYARLFSALIQSWRVDFGQGEFPFYWVQLANRGERRLWPELREAQSETLGLPMTGQAVTIDIGDSNNTHARNKQEVGRRLALIALAKVYGRDVAFSGPTFAAAEQDGAALRVRFTHANGGLLARHGPVQSLEIAGRDGNYVPAEGKIEGETLFVRSPEVEGPVAVRYAWRDDPNANLYNRAGLPAAPFRSKKP